MSEMKPVFWIKKEHFAKFDGARGDLGLTIVAWNNSLNEYAKAHELKSMDVPLYTAEQLAEAVAAERERILRTHNISVEDDLFWYFDDREYGHNEASELLQANEFEIVHIATGRNTGELFGFSTKDEDYFFKTEAEAVAAIEAIRSAAK